MKVYVVTGFLKDENSGFSLPCLIEVFATRDAAEKFAWKQACFTNITTKVVKGSKQAKK